VTLRAARLLALVLAAAVCAGGCARHTTCYGLRQEAARVGSGQPLLRWEPFQPPLEWSADPAASPGEVLKVTYDVMVLDSRTGRIAYARSGIEDPAHRVVTPLPSSSKYAWTVRPRVETTHGVRLGPWSQKVFDDVAGRTPTVPPPVETLDAIR
jgi:hypothetical protein